MATHTTLYNASDYEVACVCPMGKELAALVGMLEDEHQSPPVEATSSAYNFGRIGSHNVVIAVMPTIGNNRAASTATQLLNDFPNIRFALLVGIGGGVPSDQFDIRLGDVVVGKPSGALPAVIQYDMGKAVGDDVFQCTGILRPPSKFLLGAVERLHAQHLLKGNRIPHHIQQMLERYPEMCENGYQYPGGDDDHLFTQSYTHTTGADCTQCDIDSTVWRTTRPVNEVHIHYGTIGSGNAVVKDALRRERLRRELGVVCVEMEAAGLTDELDCLVIRGISDYSDSHKNDHFQSYSAATAAAYTKELLLSIPNLHKARGSKNTGAQKSEFKLGCYIGKAPTIEARLFVGREAELKQIAESLQQQSLQNTIILGGLGGVGKTQLALEYVRRYKQIYDSVFWLDATSESTLKTDLDFMSRLSVSKRDAGQSLDCEKAIEAFLSWLSRPLNARWLLIYDNHDDPRQYEIRKYFPPKVQGCIIMTTRSPELLSGPSITVSQLSSDVEALNILALRSGRRVIHQDPGALALVERLGRLPLAIATAGAFLKRTTFTCREYLDQYENNWANLGKFPIALPEYRDRTLYTTWNISLCQVRQENPIAAKLLQLLAYFNRSNIAFDLIAAGRSSRVSETHPWYVELATSALSFENAMRILGDYCLVNKISKAYNLHACIHDWALNALNEPVQKDLYTIAIACVTALKSTNVKVLGPSNCRRRRSLASQHQSRLDHPRLRAVLGPKDCHLAIELAEVVKSKSGIQLYLLALEGLDAGSAEDLSLQHKVMLSLAQLYRTQEEEQKAMALLKSLLSVSTMAPIPPPAVTKSAVHLVAKLAGGDADSHGCRAVLETFLAKVQTVRKDTDEITTVMEKLAYVIGKHDNVQMASSLLLEALRKMEEVLPPKSRILLTKRNKFCNNIIKYGDLKHSDTLARQLIRTSTMRTKMFRVLQIHQTIEKLARAYRHQAMIFEATELLQLLHDKDDWRKPFREHQKLRVLLGLSLRDLCVKELPNPGSEAIRSLCRLIDLTLMEEKVEPLFLGNIAFVLRRLDHTDEARVAAYYAKHLTGGDAIDRKSRCDSCKRKFPFNNGVFLCDHCFWVCLCFDCIKLYRTGTITMDQCRGGEFFNPHEPPSGEIKSHKDSRLNERDARAWLIKLQGLCTELLDACEEAEPASSSSVLGTSINWITPRSRYNVLKSSFVWLGAMIITMWELLIRRFRRKATLEAPSEDSSEDENEDEKEMGGGYDTFTDG